jgi:antitoxin ParD1/3/4
MNISLPDDMKAFVDEEVRTRGFMSSSEYVRDLIRQQREVAEFRAKLTEGANAPPSDTSDAEFFAKMRAKIGQAT